MKPLVSVVIVTRDRKEDVLRCLASCARQTHGSLEVLVVDNASSDGTPAAVREAFPHARVLELPTNMGLVGGRNHGAHHARGAYVLMLDDDTVLAPDCVERLVERAEEDPRIGIIGPKMYSLLEPDVLWYAGASFNMLTSRATNHGAWERERHLYDAERDVSHLPTAFLVRRSALAAAGGHDDAFFMSYGDADFAFRVRKAGYRVVYLPGAVLWHKVEKADRKDSLRTLGFDTPKRAYYMTRNKMIFMRRHARPWAFLVFVLFLSPVFHAFYTLKILEHGGGLPYLRMYWRGAWDGWVALVGGRTRNPTV